MNKLTKAAEAAASAAGQPIVDPAQDAKAVILNVISNRLDAMLFGDGKGSVGLAAQVAATLAFIIALVRLMMAVALLNPETPQTPWGEFKAWTRKSGVVRAINVVIGALAVLFTGAALYVVLAAREVPGSCSSASVAATYQPAPAPSSVSASAALQANATCEAAVRATDARVAQIGLVVKDIQDKQPWSFTKVLMFLACVYLVSAVTYLVIKRYDE
ncbi:MAG: hypothetical protein ACOZJX_05790 [Pseudomonadota bacterium]